MLPFTFPPRSYSRFLAMKSSTFKLRDFSLDRLRSSSCKPLLDFFFSTRWDLAASGSFLSFLSKMPIEPVLFCASASDFCSDLASRFLMALRWLSLLLGYFRVVGGGRAGVPPPHANKMGAGVCDEYPSSCGARCWRVDLVTHVRTIRYHKE